MCQRVPKRDCIVRRICDEPSILQKGNVRITATIWDRPFRDCRSSGRVELFDFTTGRGQEVVIEPDETLVEQLIHSYCDVHEQAAVTAVPDSNVIRSGCRDSISLGRVSRCDHRALVAERLYSFAGRGVPDDGFLGRRGNEQGRVWREIHSTDPATFTVLEDLFVGLCVPDIYMCPCPSSDPFAILRCRKRVDVTPFHPGHLFPVVDSPHPNCLLVTTHEIFAIRSERQSPYFLICVNFDGTPLSNDQHQHCPN